MDQRAERLARGDPSAFAELYDACADRVHHYLVVRLGSRCDADDVLQETFIRLARTKDRLATVENLVAYVFATARNEAIRSVERSARDGRLRASLSSESLFHRGKPRCRRRLRNRGMGRRFARQAGAARSAKSWS